MTTDLVYSARCSNTNVKEKANIILLLINISHLVKSVMVADIRKINLHYPKGYTDVPNVVQKLIEIIMQHLTSSNTVLMFWRKWACCLHNVYQFPNSGRNAANSRLWT